MRIDMTSPPERPAPIAGAHESNRFNLGCVPHGFASAGAVAQGPLPSDGVLMYTWLRTDDERGRFCMSAVRILGLDPGLRRTGWGVVVCEGARLTHIAHGVIAPPETLAFSERLLRLFDGITAVILEHAPQEAAIEATFMDSSAASA